MSLTAVMSVVVAGCAGEAPAPSPLSEPTIDSLLMQDRHFEALAMADDLLANSPAELLNPCYL